MSEKGSPSHSGFGSASRDEGPTHVFNSIFPDIIGQANKDSNITRNESGSSISDNWEEVNAKLEYERHLQEEGLRQSLLQQVRINFVHFLVHLLHL